MDVNLLNEAVKKSGKYKTMVLVTIIKSAGSTPRGVGAQMLVYSSGEIAGTVGGGLGEENARQAAMDMMEKNISFQRLKIDLDANIIAQEGMICGGRQEFMLELLRKEEE